MQMAYLKEFTEVLTPQFPQATFVQIAEVSDDRLSRWSSHSWLHLISEPGGSAPSLKHDGLKVKGVYGWGQVCMGGACYSSIETGGLTSPALTVFLQV